MKDMITKIGRVKFEDTPDRRRLHIGSYFTDLNESEYQALIEIFTKQNCIKHGVSGKRPSYYSQFNLPPKVVFDLQRIALADDDQAKEGGMVYRQIAQDILKAACASGAVDKTVSGGDNLEQKKYYNAGYKPGMEQHEG